MPADPVNPGDGPTYDNMDLDNNTTVRDVWGRKYMFYILDNTEHIAGAKVYEDLC